MKKNEKKKLAIASSLVSVLENMVTNDKNRNKRKQKGNTKMTNKRQKMTTHEKSFEGFTTYEYSDQVSQLSPPLLTTNVVPMYNRYKKERDFFSRNR